MEEYAITVKDLKIRYKSVQAYSIKKSLLRLKGVEAKAFEAVRGISFEVKQGEILGITGKNGSGKSTLLRALAHIFSADEGSIDLHGHSVSLLAIGVGFKNEMTGRENIMLSGMLLGFSEKEVQERMDDIIEFAGFTSRPASPTIRWIMSSSLLVLSNFLSSFDSLPFFSMNMLSGPFIITSVIVSSLIIESSSPNPLIELYT